MLTSLLWWEEALGQGSHVRVVCKERTMSLCPPETTQSYAACIHYGPRKT